MRIDPHLLLLIFLPALGARARARGCGGSKRERAGSPASSAAACPRTIAGGAARARPAPTLLPPPGFSSSIGLEPHMLRRNWAQILLLAWPGVVVYLLLVAVGAK